MKLNSKFTFGRYKGLTLQNVYQGKLNPDRGLLKRYLDKVLNNRHPHIPTHTQFEFIEKFHVSDFEIEIVGQIFNEELPSTNSNRVAFGNFEKEVKGFINYHFSSNWLGIIENIQDYNAKQETMFVLGADPEYVVWCIREIESFKINEATILELQELTISRFLGVDLLYMSHNTYEYTPIIRTDLFKFSDNVIQLNNSK